VGAGRIVAIAAGLCALAAPGAPRADDPVADPSVQEATACTCSEACAAAFGYGSVCRAGHCGPYLDEWSLLDWVGLGREGTRTPAPFVLLPAVLPAVGYTPAMGFVFGATGNLAMFLGPSQTTTISSMQVVALYSTMSQLTVQATSTVLAADNAWELQGDWRFLLFNQKTYGLGNGPFAFSAPASLEDFDLVRVHENVLRRVWRELYVGAGYGLDRYYAVRDVGMDLASPAPVVGPNYAYSLAYGFDPSQYTVSGVALAALWDSRDSTVDPYRGIYGSATFSVNPPWLGSTRASTSMEAQFRAYVPMNVDVPRDLLAFWAYYRGITSGVAPYLDLPAIGWDQKSRTGRGYVQGRWRGTQELYAEAEWRFRITSNGVLGGVLFANASSFAAPAFEASGPGWTYSSPKTSLLQYVRPAAGFGLRFLMNRDSRSNVTLDFAFGESSFGVWFNAGEYF
jgi:hypothetical protein